MSMTMLKEQQLILLVMILGFPKYEVDECSQRGLTFGAPLLVNFRLIVWDIDEEAGTKVSKRY